MLTVTATSCVEMPEGKGIDDVYTSRVDFIKAQTTLKAAELKLKEAQTATENARTMQMEANVKAQDLRNKIADTKNAQDKAVFEEQLKLLKAQDEIKLAWAQTDLVNAQRVYQQALANLELLTKNDIPLQYQSKLFGLKDRLNTLSYNISQKQSDLTGKNLLLVFTMAKDTAGIANSLNDNIKVWQNTLDNSIEQLNSLKALKTVPAEEQKNALKAKIDALNAEIATNTIKANILENNRREAYTTYSTAYNLLYTKCDYKAEISIPNAISGEFNTYFSNNLDKKFNFLSSDLKTYTFVGCIPSNWYNENGNWNLRIGLINQLNTIASFVNSKVSANPPAAELDAWKILKTSISNAMNSYSATSNELSYNLQQATIVHSAKNNESNSISKYISLLTSNLSGYTSLYNGITSIDAQIANAEKSVAATQANLAGAKVSLDTFRKSGYNDNNNFYYFTISDLRKSITSITTEVADMQTEFELVTKEKDALIALINNQNK